MPFEKEDPRINRNGRKKGSKNTVPYDLRENINYFLNDKFDEIIKEFSKLNSRDKIKFYIDFIQYSLPRLKSVENFNNEIKEEEKLDLSCLSNEELHIINDIHKKIIEHSKNKETN